MRIRSIKSAALCFTLMANSVLGVSGQVVTKRETAIVSITLTVGERARDGLIQQLMKFADARGFTMRVGHIRDARHFYIELWREDMNLSVANPFNDAALFSIGIYQTGKNTLPRGDIDSIINDIKEAISGIQGIVIDTIKR